MALQLRQISSRSCGQYPGSVSVENLKSRLHSLKRRAEEVSCPVCLDELTNARADNQWVSVHPGHIHAMCLACRTKCDATHTTTCPVCRLHMDRASAMSKIYTYTVGYTPNEIIPMRFYNPSRRGFGSWFWTDDWVWHQANPLADDSVPYVMVRLTKDRMKVLVMQREIDLTGSWSEDFIERTYSTRKKVPLTANLVTGKTSVSVSFLNAKDAIVFNDSDAIPVFLKSTTSTYASVLRFEAIT